MNIIIILLNFLSLSFQIIQSALFCDDQIRNIYVYNENTRAYTFLLRVWAPEDCWKPDYINLDIEPGARIKFECYNEETSILGGGCFLINNQCKCYDFNLDGYSFNNTKGTRLFQAKFNNNIT